MEDDRILDIITDSADLFRYLRRREGLISMLLIDSPEYGVQLTAKSFLRHFPEHVKQEYDSEGGKKGLKGVAYHNGVRFFALLEMDTLQDMEEMA